MADTSRLPYSFHVLAKPTGAICNLDCRYCFFLSKDALYPGSAFRMSDEVLDDYIRQLLEAQEAPEVVIAWQGGEPTLMGLEFFERSIACIGKWKRPGQQVSCTIQTNGTRLDDAWCDFFQRHTFLVGLSVDGPRAMHDAYRVNRGGAGTFDEVMRGWERLSAHGVDVNILCTVHAANAGNPVEVYRFFRDELGARFLQFIPIVERATPESLPAVNGGWGERPAGSRPLYVQAGSVVSDRSVRAEQYGGFLCGVFDEWLRRDVGTVFVQTFDAALASWVGQHSLCIVAPTCGNAVALEHNGDLYACDHYVEPGYRLGNILETPLGQLVASDRQRAFGQAKLDTLPKYCRDCDVLFACYGECPRNRFIHAPGGEPGLNYLCAGYRRFYRHIREPMEVMAGLLQQGRPPAEIMVWHAAREQARYARARRNEPCPCGSGKKFKRCHGAATGPREGLPGAGATPS